MFKKFLLGVTIFLGMVPMQAEQAHFQLREFVEEPGELDNQAIMADGSYPVEQFQHEAPEDRDLDDKENEPETILPGGCYSPEFLEKQEEARESIFSRLSSGTWRMVMAPFKLSAKCARKLCKATKKCFCIVHNTADNVFYVVGFATTGLVIYALVNGEFKKDIQIIRILPGSDQAEEVMHYLYSVENPFGGTILWDMPESAGVLYETLAKSNMALAGQVEKAQQLAVDIFTEGSVLLADLSDELGRSDLTNHGREFIGFLHGKLEKSVQAMEGFLKQ